MSQRLEKGFECEDGLDVDGFIDFSLRVHNRRKSRMGRSLENHLEAVFKAHEVRHVRNAVTEKGNKPDFLFPDAETYRTAPKGSSEIDMLGAKSSCKERWRQILDEADKIPRKHFLTLDAGISERQFQKLHLANLQLVIPESSRILYTDAQQESIWNLSQFIEVIAAKHA